METLIRTGRTCLIAGLNAVFAVLMAGCANPGLPKPPSLRLPATVTDLSVSRVGDQVELRWTAPSHTTDGLEVEAPTVVEVCRDWAVVPGSGSTKEAMPRPRLPAVPAPCTTVLSIPGHSGASMAIAKMPPEVNGANVRQAVAFRIRVLNSAGRSAAPSVPALVPGGPAPEPVVGFRAEQQKGGVLLRWRAGVDDEVSGRVEVVRTLHRIDAGAQGKSTSKAPKTEKRSGRAKATTPESQRADSTGSVRLQQAEEGSGTGTANSLRPGAAPDGMVDEGATDGQTYSYVAQRVKTFSAQGMTLQMASDPTVAVVVTMRDTFPPAVPTGLISIPSRAKDGTGATIDLAWEPNSEVDLAGYVIYRAELGRGVAGESREIRLTATVIQGPAYRDAAVAAGHRYVYRVTAVDQHGNESRASAPVTDTTDAQ